MQKEHIWTFVENLARSHRLVGPVARPGNQISFEYLDDHWRDMVLDYPPSQYPPKSILFPRRETLLTFTINGEPPQVSATVTAEPTAIFGIHACDLHGIRCLDMVFADGVPDPYYHARRAAALLIGVSCRPDAECFCASMGTLFPPEGGFDLFLTDLDTAWLVQVGSEKGAAALADNVECREATAEQIRQGQERLAARALQQKGIHIRVEHLPLLFGGEYHDPIWDELGERCISCGECNFVCPTCYCFDVADEMDPHDSTSGRRVRTWDACQLPDFAVVAGGKNYRDTAAQRNRHRFYRKFLYPVLKYKKSFCVGCGRCVRSCPVDIQIVDTVNHFVEQNLPGGKS
ncbi:MAG: 4Fe-4S dicluster domain-containing protein [Acidobacteria bacterium]|nr:4Fe-4S dicluster domain-containing protein [Acidobacteriota bacterium]